MFFSYLSIFIFAVPCISTLTYWFSLPCISPYSSFLSLFPFSVTFPITYLPILSLSHQSALLNDISRLLSSYSSLYQLFPFSLSHPLPSNSLPFLSLSVLTNRPIPDRSFFSSLPSHPITYLPIPFLSLSFSTNSPIPYLPIPFPFPSSSLLLHPITYLPLAIHSQTLPFLTTCPNPYLPISLPFPTLPFLSIPPLTFSFPSLPHLLPFQRSIPFFTFLVLSLRQPFPSLPPHPLTSPLSSLGLTDDKQDPQTSSPSLSSPSPFRVQIIFFPFSLSSFFFLVFKFSIYFSFVLTSVCFL